MLNEVIIGMQEDETLVIAVVMCPLCKEKYTKNFDQVYNYCPFCKVKYEN